MFYLRFINNNNISQVIQNEFNSWIHIGFRILTEFEISNLTSDIFNRMNEIWFAKWGFSVSVDPGVT